MDQLTEIEEGVIRELPGGAKIVASVFGLDYCASPNLRTETVELEDGTVMFDGLELWLTEEGKKPILLLNVNGLDPKTYKLAATVNEGSVENYEEMSAVLGWIEDAILDYENEKYGELDYKIMREDEAGDRAYHDSIDA